MNAPSPMLIISLLLFVCGMLLLLRARRKALADEVLEKLRQPASGSGNLNNVSWLRRQLLQAGVDLGRGQLLALVTLYMALALLVLITAGARMLLFAVLVSVAGGWLVLRWRYFQRVEKMISQLPDLLEHVSRSLKSGRTLGDAMLLAIDRTEAPLREALTVCKRGISLGLPLADVFDDFAQLYDRRELQMLATSIKVNQRYGGNVSHLMENLITTVRDQERAAAQMRAMTGESRVGAWVIGVMPLLIGGYIFASNPEFFLGLWNNETGRTLVYSALSLQILGCLVLWRMMRSIR